MNRDRRDTAENEELTAMVQAAPAISDLEATFWAERPRLVRLCTRLTGDATAAEDLAQEALLEAWHNHDKLRDPGKRVQWLSGIARNMCRRWLRGRARQTEREIAAGTESSRHSEPVDSFDLEIDLERDELAVLLDRALELLPAETRTILVQRYIDESPHAEIAARLGVGETVVAKRLERGRLALRRVLADELRADAATYGLLPAGDQDSDWAETRVWCPFCGQRKLLALKSAPWLTFWCPHCCGNEERALGVGFTGQSAADLRSFKAAFNRIAVEGRDWYQQVFEARIAHCVICGRPLPTRPGLTPPIPSPFDGQTATHIYCPSCDSGMSFPVAGLALALPEGKRFWRDNPRIHLLPEGEIESGGGPALVTRFQSVTSTALFEVVWVRDSLEVISIHGAPAR